MHIFAHFIIDRILHFGKLTLTKGIIMWISKKKFKELEKSTEALLKHIEELQNNAFLIGIERSGRQNIFKFLRGGKIYEIHTMGMISDDINAWKKELLNDKHS